MREFELVIDKALKVGLSPEINLPFNSQFLWEALGFRCGRAGLEPFIHGENPLPLATVLYYNWPFPQFVVGEEYNFLIVRDAVLLEDTVYVVSDDHLTVTPICSIDIATYGTGQLMEVADFGEYVFMTNGVCMIYWDITTSTWIPVVSTASVPLLGTICNFKGQGVGGCVLSVWYGCDSTFYVWTKIGHLDFVPNVNNESGYRRCPYGGEVYHVRRLGDNVVGYSSKGITLLTPVNDPAPTFGFKELSNIGLVNRGAVNGSLHRQVYVGSDLIVREITSQGIKELGYKYWMDELGGDIIVSYDRSTDDFFIGDSVRTFLLSPQGMTDIPQHPSTVWRGDPDNVYMLPDTVDAGYKPTITTEVFDMEYKGQKTIFTVETDAMLGTNPHAAVDWADDFLSFGPGVFTPINNMGIATPITSGNMFRFRIRFDLIGDIFRIGYIRARYKMTDLRGIRGVYAPPPRGQ